MDTVPSIFCFWKQFFC